MLNANLIEALQHFPVDSAGRSVRVIRRPADEMTRQTSPAMFTALTISPGTRPISWISTARDPYANSLRKIAAYLQSMQIIQEKLSIIPMLLFHHS